MLISYARKVCSVSGTGTDVLYSVKLTNNSSSNWAFCLYQQIKSQPSNVLSLVWFCSPYMVLPSSYVVFQWQVDYGFFWCTSVGQTTQGGYQAADPNTANLTLFSTTPVAPNLSIPVQGTPQGDLLIKTASDVPSNTFAVGTSMSSYNTLSTMASPNLTHTFQTPMTYWIIAVSSVQSVGAVFDYTTANQSTQVVFPENIYHLSYNLNSANVWVPC